MFIEVTENGVEISININRIALFKSVSFNGRLFTRITIDSTWYINASEPIKEIQEKILIASQK
ncbi:MAG: hypothetical protein IPO78_17190 [Saprospiraceae bacterium]|nr:hypothetical protein [Saprospiraceae bacterium]